MFKVAVAARQNQQPRFIPFWHGLLRDEFGRQDKIKIGGSHGGEFQVSDGNFQAVPQISFAAFFTPVGKL